MERQEKESGDSAVGGENPSPPGMQSGHFSSQLLLMIWRIFLSPATREYKYISPEEQTSEGGGQQNVQRRQQQRVVYIRLATHTASTAQAGGIDSRKKASDL